MLILILYDIYIYGTPSKVIESGLRPGYPYTRAKYAIKHCSLSKKRQKECSGTYQTSCHRRY